MGRSCSPGTVQTKHVCTACVWNSGRRRPRGGT